MAESKELKKIKKLYGEKFMHLCREFFPTLLEQEGLLLDILESSFATNSRTLAEDIIDNELEEDFKDYVFSKVDVEKEKPEKIVNKTPYEILDEAGYNLIECKTEEEIQKFRKYYSKNEVICTIYNGGRLKSSVVFFAVKKDVETIKRENFEKPRREDEYGTSVLGIQFDKHGTCIPHIITRYNHTVNNPNATFGNDLDRIAPGLTESFAKLLDERGLELNKSNIEKFGLPGYTVASDGKYYKYNMEINGKYYCPGNIIIGNGQVKKLENSESQMLIDYFIVDTKKKAIQQVEDMTFKDGFGDFFKDKEIESINIEKEKDASKVIRIKIKDLENDVLIEIDKDNNIVGYDNKELKEVGDDFLWYNQQLRKLNLPQLEEVGNDFLYCNKQLSKINLPQLTKVGDCFLYNEQLSELNLPQLTEVGNNFLYYNGQLTELNLLQLKNVGNWFLSENKQLKKLNLPQLTEVGNNFLYYNEQLTELNLPQLEEAGWEFLHYNEQLSELNLPKLKKVGTDFLYCNEQLSELNLPQLTEVGDCFLSRNRKLRKLNLPKLTNVGSYQYNKQISKYEKTAIQPKDIAELDKDNQLTTTEISFARKIIENIRNLFSKRNDQQK